MFFPISGVFRYRQTLPVRAQELALQCLSILFQSGWSTISDADVVLQLLVLLTYLADGESQQQNAHATSTGLRQSGLDCLAGLFAAVTVTSDLQKRLLDDANMPALGHAVTVMLDALRATNDPDLQLNAARSLQIFVSRIASFEMLRSFFPGITSSLVQVSKVQGSPRPSFKVLMICLQVLRQLVEGVLSDTRQSTRGQSAHTVLAQQSDGWIKKTSSHMEIVLATVAQLRNHARPEVRQELKELCWTILADCIITLADVVPVALNVILSLLAYEEISSDVSRLEGLLAAEVSVAEAARNLLYEWIGMLPQMLSSSDDHANVTVVRKTRIMRALLESAEINLELVDDLLFSNLVDGLSDMTQAYSLGPSHLGLPSGRRLVTSPQWRLYGVQGPTKGDGPENETPRSKVYQEVDTLLERVGDSREGLRLARRSLHQARLSEGSRQSIYLWICTSMSRNRSIADHLGYEFLDVDPDDSALESNLLHQDLYGFALSILDTSSEDQRLLTVDSRVLALDAVTLQARRARENFRLELVDTLYLVVQLIGSPDALVQRRAMSALDTVASACGYADTQDMLVDNVDYLVNAIGLKLNSYDISPQVPQVLIMMTRLCGSKLVPYLDDLVDSTFEALEHFHGYGRLVELLFSMLDAVVEAGAQALPFVMVEGPERADHRKPQSSNSSIADAIAEIRKARQKHTSLLATEATPQADHLPQTTPQQPWESLRSSTPAEFDKLIDERAGSAREQPSDVSHDHAALEEPELSKEMPLTKTYTMVLRIAQLTQHHLPSPSPSIRALLLSLLLKAIPFLSRHEDSFLPLVNVLWPMLVARVADDEAIVISSVLDVMSSICEGAGDFMNTRIEGIWPTIQQIWHRLDGRTSRSKASARPARAQPSQRSTQDDPKAQEQVPFSTSEHGQLVPQASTILKDPRMSDKSESVANASMSIAVSAAGYIPTTAITIRSALTRFLVSVLNHVRVSEVIFGDMLHKMLYDEVTKEPRNDVQEALARLNPDAVWLVLQRWTWSHGQQGSGLKHPWIDVQPSAVNEKHFAMA